VTFAFAGFTVTPIADLTMVMDFTDLATDLGALLVAVLFLVLIMWGVSIGTHSLRHLAK
jgi:hypothetical protein